ncbi:MAG: DUF2861 family protein [Myxococcota bacterium]
MTRILGVGLALVLMTSGAAAQGQVVTPALVEAHEAFAEGDYLRMTRKLRETLEQNPEDEHVRRNALDLLERAYALNGGRVPADWKLPAGVQSMRLSVARKADGEEFRIRLSGELARAGIVEELRLVQFPSRVILDKRAGVGIWEERQPAGEEPEYELVLDDQRDPIEEGLYTLHIATTDGHAVDGHVIVSNVVATATPVIRSPVPGETLRSDEVRYQWDDFVSPQRKAYEWRGLWVGVARCAPPAYAWDEVWGQYFEHPNAASPDELRAKPLPAGRYFMYLSFKETRAFGDVKVRRESNNAVPFHVVDP